ncbi:alpha/beta hydrolase [Candidatus Sumerlaeota bacterium]|nr:alpha/beta hydrolase [Candidatus Sumerlaeota bacterium]
MPGFFKSKVRIKMVLLYGLIGLLLIAPLPVIFQNKLIYFPYRYDPAFKPGEGRLKDFHPYTTLDGRKQWGILIEPAPASDSRRRPSPLFYLAFNGNASSAMDMADFYEELARRTGCGFFVVDYRGYGFNDGKPSEVGLTADALGTYDTMQQEGHFANGVGVIGHSLGGGAAFAVAEKRPVSAIITMSTFTSMDDVAKKTVFWPYPHFLWNHWPNDRRLVEILARPDAERPARIVLFHAENDEIIPIEIGRKLASNGGDAVQFIPLKGATHNDVHEFAIEKIVQILLDSGAM